MTDDQPQHGLAPRVRAQYAVKAQVLAVAPCR